MIFHKIIYKTLFIISLFLQVIIPSLEFIVIFSGVLTFMLLSENKLKISKSIFNVLSFLILILVIGVLTSFLHTYEFFDRIRDLTHFLRPIIILLFAYLLAMKVDDTRFILRTIIFMGFLFAIKHLIILSISDLSIGTISEIRMRGGYGSFIELIALVMIISRVQVFNVFRSRFLKNIILLFLIISFVLYFSRTMFVAFIIFSLATFGYLKLTSKGLKYGFIVIFSISLFYIYLFSINLERGKPGIDSFLYKLKIAPSEIFITSKNIDINNHESLWDHWRAYEASIAIAEMKQTPSSLLIGKGFGALVDLKFKAPLNEEGLRFIPHLHNGYIYIFYKTGVLGLIIYLIIILNLYKQTYKKSKTFNEVVIRNFISGFGLYFLFSSLIITGMYNLEEISMFILGIFFFILNKESKPKQLNV